MSESHFGALQILVAAVALLVLAIAMPFILKAFRKSPPSETPLSTTSSDGSTETTTDSKTETKTDSRQATKTEIKLEAESSTLLKKEEKPASLRSALHKTEENILGRLRGLFSKNNQIPALDDIEEILYTSDLGPSTVQRLMSSVEDELSSKERQDFETVKKVLKNEMEEIFQQAPAPEKSLREATSGPTVLLVVGVNGAGKTTSIGKFAAQWAQEGRKVLVAAGDTFRAAAGSQLQVWTKRAQVEIFNPPQVTDPSAVAFDAVSRAQAQKYDRVIIDTAGRLHTQDHLMEELKKVKRVVQKVIPEAPHEIWIVLDANSGQNALIQAKEFHQALGLTGVVLTKMDGTAKGGVAVGVTQELKIPIRWIGVGEKISDLRPFSSREFIESIFS